MALVIHLAQMYGPGFQKVFPLDVFSHKNMLQVVTSSKISW